MKSKGTLFEKEVEDVFLKSLSKEPTPKTGPKIFGTHFHICSSASKKNYYRYYFELRDHYVFCRKESNKREIAFMDVKNAFIKMTSGTLIKGKVYFGLKFIKKKTYEELYHADEEVIQQWFEYLKNFCILTKFRYFLVKSNSQVLFRVQASDWKRELRQGVSGGEEEGQKRVCCQGI